MIEAICREGYIIAQQYLPEAEQGDTRLFLLNGRLLNYKNQVTAVHCAQVEGEGNIRSNLTAGAIRAKAEVTPQMLEIAEIVRPKRVLEGMFFVGLHIVSGVAEEAPGAYKDVTAVVDVADWAGLARLQPLFCING